MLTIALWSEHPGHGGGSTLDVPDPANWPLAEAIDLAMGFALCDASQPTHAGSTPLGNPICTTHRVELVGIFSDERYERMTSLGDQGDLHFSLTRDTDGNVFLIAIMVGNGSSVCGHALK